MCFLFFCHACSLVLYYINSFIIRTDFTMDNIGSNNVNFYINYDS